MSSEIKVDTISENTSANGVVIDSVTLKDGGVTATAASTITTADNTDTLTLISTDADANAGPILVLNRDSASPADGDSLGALRFAADDDAGNSTNFFSIESFIRDASNGSEDVQMVMYGMSGGSTLNIMEFDTVGGGVDAGPEVVFNDGSSDIDFRVESNGNTNALFIEGGSNRNGMFLSTADLGNFNELNNHSAGHLVVGDGSGGNAGITIFSEASANGHLSFADGTSGVAEYKGLVQYQHGSDRLILYANHTSHFIIASDGTLTATDTSIGAISSDQRLKENIQDYSYDISKFKTMKPRSFDWKFPDAHPYEAKVGFVAQELETVDSELVITEDFIENTIKPANFDDEKALLTDGKKKTTKLGKKDAMYISVIQQLIARIEALESA